MSQILYFNGGTYFIMTKCTVSVYSVYEYFFYSSPDRENTESTRAQKSSTQQLSTQHHHHTAHVAMEILKSN